MDRRLKKNVCAVCNLENSRAGGANDFMICCDACEHWFHGRCVKVDELDADDFATYHCLKCTPRHGPSVLATVKNNHRYDCADAEGQGKPTQTGTKKFIAELKQRQFPSNDEEILLFDSGESVDANYFDKNPFDKPIMFKSSENLSISLPYGISLERIGQLVGVNRSVDVIDVNRQRTFNMKMSKFIKSFHPPRSHVLNLISMEVSGSDLGRQVDEPALVSSISWVDKYWPNEKRSLDLSYMKPNVSKFCLISMQESYTDFHIDFSGTSVWYAPVMGSKVFYLVPPTVENLRTFENWMRSPFHSEQFFGDLVPRCFALDVHQGNVLLIPTGWIHAVFTPEDSIVFGGNFLHTHGIDMQISIFDMERQLNLPEKFIFPHFILLHWIVAWHLLESIKECNEEEIRAPQFTLNAAQSLLDHLKQWNVKSKTDRAFAVSCSCLPENLSCSELLKLLEKALAKNTAFKNETRPERGREQHADPAQETSASIVPKEQVAEARTDNFKLKIRIPVNVMTQDKDTESDEIELKKKKKKKKKKKQKVNDQEQEVEQVASSSVDVVPYLQLDNSADEATPLDIQKIFPPSFVDSKRPILGYSLEQLKYYEAASPLLMAGSNNAELQAKLEADGTRAVELPPPPPPQPPVVSAEASSSRSERNQLTAPNQGKVRKARVGAEVLQRSKDICGSRMLKAAEVFAKVTTGATSAKPKSSTRKRLAQKLKIDTRRMR